MALTRNFLLLILVLFFASTFTIAGCGNGDDEDTGDGDTTDDCTGVTCGPNASCDEGECVCDDGFTGDPEDGCTEEDECAGITCGTNAYCTGGTCFCNEGFEGDPLVACEAADPCADVTCGDNATCEDGECACDDGFEGDPDAGCTPVGDPCENVICGDNASCEDGACICDDGFEGDPDTGCTPIADPCTDVTCGDNAHCEDGFCVCDDGFEGDPDVGCTEIVDPCEGVTCGDNAHCEEGACVCDDGFEGDPDVACTADPCEGVMCGDNAHCEEGDCVCDDGFEGDADTACTPIDFCAGVFCGENAHCDGGACLCNDGFVGSPIFGCTPENPCAEVTCGTNATCIEGDCYCDNGYSGDPDVECTMADSCDDIDCGPNATCDAGLCSCDENYENYRPGLGCTEIDYCDGVDCETLFSPNSLCVVDLLEEGYYTCICKPGYQLDDVTGECVQFCEDDDLEDNDNQDNPTFIDLPFMRDDLISSSSNWRDFDIFAVSAPAGTWFKADLLFSNDEGDLDFYLYWSGDPSAEIAYSESTTDNEQIIKQVEEDGYYFFLVLPYDADLCVPYSLSIETLEDPCAPGDLCTGDYQLCEFLPDQDPNYMCICEDGYRMNDETGECEEFCPDDTYEPNDTRDEATPITLPYDEGDLVCSIDSADWYSFTVEPSSVITIDLTFLDDDGNLDLFLQQDETNVASSMSYTDDESIEYYSEAGGDFMINVLSWETDACATYTMTVTGETVDNPCLAEINPCTDPHQECLFHLGEDPDYTCECEDGWVWNEELEVCEDWCPDDALEPNDTVEDATVLTLPANLTDLNVEGLNFDVYRIDVTEGDLILIDTIFLDDDGDIDIHLYEDGADITSYDYVAYSSSSTDNEHISYTADMTGSYYLRVKIYSGNYCTPYSLSVYAGADPCEGMCEGENQVCEAYSYDPYFVCECDSGFVWDETQTSCVADPCEDVDCETDFSDYSHCEIDWAQDLDYVCVCDDDFEEIEGVCTFVCEDDDFEENDGSDAPTRLALPFNETGLKISAVSYSERDYDWYVIQLTAGEAVSISATFTHADGNIDMRLFDYAADNDATDSVKSSSSYSDNELLEYLSEEGGMYFLRVHVSGTLICTTYDLAGELLDDPCDTPDICPAEEACEWRVGYDPNFDCVCQDSYYRDDEEACILCEDDPLEDNDTAETATTVTLPYAAEDLVSFSSESATRDYDWFAFDLAIDQTVTIDATFLHSDADIDIHLYAASDTTDDIASSISTSDNEQIIYTALETGTYYLRVQALGTNKCAPYDIAIAVAE